MVTGGVYKVVHKKGTILGKDIFPLPEAPFVSKLRLGWYNVAGCDGTGRRMDAADGVDKLMPVKRWT